VRNLAAVAAAAVVLSSSVFAHDVPDDVVVQAFLHPSGARLSLVVRVPLTAMRDVDVPARAGGFVDLTRVEPALRHAATIWLVQGIEVQQDGSTELLELFGLEVRIGELTVALELLTVPAIDQGPVGPRLGDDGLEIAHLKIQAAKASFAPTEAMARGPFSMCWPTARTSSSVTRSSLATISAGSIRAPSRSSRVAR